MTQRNLVVELSLDVCKAINKPHCLSAKVDLNCLVSKLLVCPREASRSLGRSYCSLIVSHLTLLRNKSHQWDCGLVGLMI